MEAISNNAQPRRAPGLNISKEARCGIPQPAIHIVEANRRFAMMAEFPSILYPDRQSTNNLISAALSASEIRDAPAAIRDALIARSIDAGLLHPDASVRQLAASIHDQKQNYETLIFLIAALEKRITPVVASKDFTRAYLLRPEVWRGEVADFAHPITLALNGRFIVAQDAFPQISLEYEMYGAGIFIKRAQHRRLLRSDHVSRETLNEIAKKVIERFRSKNPDKRMPLDDFISDVKREVPASDREIRRAWKLHAPATWRHSGRKR